MARPVCAGLAGAGRSLNRDWAALHSVQRFLLRGGPGNDLVAAYARVNDRSIQLGGFDHHDGLIGPHEGLLGPIDFAFDAFYRATVELGVAQNVTTFTASDFGRTLASNGDGSDHGWGSHHCVVGGS